MVKVYAGLDVSDKVTHVCVVGGLGAVVWSGAWESGDRSNAPLSFRTVACCAMVRLGNCSRGWLFEVAQGVRF